MPRAIYVIRIGLLLACCVLGRQAAEAQSFDCAKASTPVEHAVCSDAQLRDLDSILSAEMKAVLARAPDTRKALVADQRAWLRARDNCAVSPKEVSARCLAEAYGRRISYMRTQLPDAPARPNGLPSPETCKTIARRYSAIADAHLGEPPLRVLAKLPGSGVTLAEALAQFSYLPADLREWGSKQNPPITFPDELTQRWPGQYGTLERLPGENLYRLVKTTGTMHCYESLYFTVEEGVATLSEQSSDFGAGSEDNGASCGTSSFFGQLDQAPVAFEEDYDWGPRLSSSINVTAWEGSHSIGNCDVTLSFEPQFSDQTLNDWDRLKKGERACSGTGCDDLHRAALTLVAAVQDAPKGAQLDALAALTPTQRAEYAAAIGAKPGEEPLADSLVDAEAFLDDSPLQLPYVRNGRVYVASFGHYTIGWRTFADWNVSFELIDHGTLGEKSLFPIGMTKGKPAVITPEP